MSVHISGVPLNITNPTKNNITNPTKGGRIWNGKPTSSENHPHQVNWIEVELNCCLVY
jgi:hypothetical protein